MKHQVLISLILFFLTCDVLGSWCPHGPNKRCYSDSHEQQVITELKGWADSPRQKKEKETMSKEQITSKLDTQQTMLSNLQTEIINLNNKLDKIFQLESNQNQLKSEVADLKDKLGKKIDIINNELEQKVYNLGRDMGQKFENQKDFILKLEANQNKLKNEVTVLSNKLNTAVSEVNKKFGEQTDFSLKLEANQNKLRSEVSDIKKNFGTKVVDINDKFEQKVYSFKVDIEKEFAERKRLSLKLEANQNILSIEVTDLKNKLGELGAKVVVINDQFKQKVYNLKLDIEKGIADLRTDVNSKLAANQNILSIKVTDLKNKLGELDVKVVGIHDQFKQKVFNLTRDIEKEFAEGKNVSLKLEANQNKLGSGVTDLRNKLGVLGVKVDGIHDQFQQKVFNLTRDIDLTFADLRTYVNSKLEANQNKLGSGVTDLKNKLGVLGVKVDGIHDQFKQKVFNLTRDIEKEFAEGKNVSLKLEANQNKLGSGVSELKEKLEVNRNKLGSEVSDLKNKLGELGGKVVVINDQFKQKVHNLKLDIEKGIADLRTDVNSKLAANQNILSIKVTDLKNKLGELGVKVVRIHDQFKQKVFNLTRDIDLTFADLRTDVNSKLEANQNKLGSGVTDLKHKLGVLGVKVDGIHDQFKQKVFNLTRDIEREFAEEKNVGLKLEANQNKLGSGVTDLKNKLGVLGIKVDGIHDQFKQKVFNLTRDIEKEFAEGKNVSLKLEANQNKLGSGVTDLKNKLGVLGVKVDGIHDQFQQKVFNLTRDIDLTFADLRTDVNSKLEANQNKLGSGVTDLKHKLGVLGVKVDGIHDQFKQKVFNLARDIEKEFAEGENVSLKLEANQNKLGSEVSELKEKLEVNRNKLGSEVSDLKNQLGVLGGKVVDINDQFEQKVFDLRLETNEEFAKWKNFSLSLEANQHKLDESAVGFYNKLSKDIATLKDKLEQEIVEQIVALKLNENKLGEQFPELKSTIDTT